ncbi:MAG: hypothetical protein KIS92_14095 [Planctomycetota bacterium]|nr:hypothetical protein [Planctomycetota bacterium]
MAQCFSCGVEAGEALYEAKNGMQYCAKCHIQKIGPLPGSSTEPAESQRTIFINAWAVMGIVALVAIPTICYLAYKSHLRSKAAQMQHEAEQAEKERLHDEKVRMEIEAKNAELAVEAEKKRKADEAAEAERKRVAEEKRKADLAVLEAKKKAEADARKADEDRRKQEAAERAAEQAAKLQKEKEEREAKEAAVAEANREKAVEQAKQMYKNNFFASNAAENRLAEEKTKLAAAQNRIKSSTREIEQVRTSAGDELKKLCQYYKIGTPIMQPRHTTLRNPDGSISVMDTPPDPWAEYERLKPTINSAAQGKMLNADEAHSAALAKLKTKFDSLNLDLQNSTNQVGKSTEEIASLQSKFDEARTLLESARETLVKYGIKPEEVAGSSSAVAAKPLDEKALATYPVYVLKSGQKIVAVMAVDAGDIYSVKDEKGKMHTLKKEDVAEIVKPK